MLSNCVGTTQLNFSNESSIGCYFKNLSLANVITELDKKKSTFACDSMSAIAMTTNNFDIGHAGGDRQS